MDAFVQEDTSDFRGIGVGFYCFFLFPSPLWQERKLQFPRLHGALFLTVVSQASLQCPSVVSHLSVGRVHTPSRSDEAPLPSSKDPGFRMDSLEIHRMRNFVH